MVLREKVHGTREVFCKYSQLGKTNVGWARLSREGLFQRRFILPQTLHRTHFFLLFPGDHRLCEGASIQRLWAAARVPHHFKK